MGWNDLKQRIVSYKGTKYLFLPTWGRIYQKRPHYTAWTWVEKMEDLPEPVQREFLLWRMSQ